MGIPPRNKKRPFWPTIPSVDLQQGPVVQVRQTRERVLTMSLAELRPLHLANAYPAREPRNYKGRRPTSGGYWSSTMRDLVWYESRLERETVLLADFDPTVVQIVSQPCRLTVLIDGKRRSHTPDYALIRSAISLEIINCKPRDFVDDPKNLELHSWVGAAFRQSGVKHSVVSELPTATAANLAALASTRNPRWTAGLPLDLVLAACTDEISIGDLVQTLEASLPRFATLACVRALLWRRVLETDLTKALSNQSTLRFTNA